MSGDPIRAGVLVEIDAGVLALVHNRGIKLLQLGKLISARLVSSGKRVWGGAIDALHLSNSRKRDTQQTTDNRKPATHDHLENGSQKTPVCDCSAIWRQRGTNRLRTRPDLTAIRHKRLAE